MDLAAQVNDRFGTRSVTIQTHAGELWLLDASAIVDSECSVVQPLDTAHGRGPALDVGQD
jgi:hypothetical protein